MCIRDRLYLNLQRGRRTVQRRAARSGGRAADRHIALYNYGESIVRQNLNEFGRLDVFQRQRPRFFIQRSRTVAHAVFPVRQPRIVHPAVRRPRRQSCYGRKRSKHNGCQQYGQTCFPFHFLPPQFVKFYHFKH